MGQIREYPPPSTPRAVKINLPFHIFLQVYNWVIGLFLWTRLAISRPLGERSEPCLASKRPTASDEVARGPTKDFWKVYLWTCWYFMYFILHHGIASKCLNQFDENCIDQSESFLPQSARHMLDCRRLVKKEDILEETTGWSVTSSFSNSVWLEVIAGENCLSVGSLQRSTTRLCMMYFLVSGTLRKVCIR